MAYYIDLFSPDTYQTFTNSDKTVSGFRATQKNLASKIRPGDKFICYLTKLKRWVGVLEVTSDYFIDDKPIFTSVADPFVIRFNVKPLVLLPLDKSIPINEDIVWNYLSFTKNLQKNSPLWTAMVRCSLRKLEDQDGEYLEKILMAQLDNPVTYELNELDEKKLKAPTVKIKDSKKVSA